MCGIAGEVIADRSSVHLCDSQVRRMVGQMKPRGPDGDGFRTGEGAAIGMCRLAIIDIERGTQPISSADGRYHIVYNGECYGVDELRETLRSKGAVFRTETDTEVVLYTFIYFGAEGLHRLNGMFAFAIWDSVERALFVARDRLGIKPLYYSHQDGRLIFASTLSAIESRSDFAGTLDHEAIELYLSVKFVPSPRTIYCEVRKLPAGHWLSFSDGRLQLSQWWDYPESQERVTSLAEAAVQSESLIRQAAQCRLVSERPVGLCLSGGVDSGLLGSFLRNNEICSYSMGFPGTDYDESPAASRVAKHLGIQQQTFESQEAIDADFEAVVNAYDEPLADSSSIALFQLSREMSRHVTVALSGTGGDEQFGGYMRYVGSRFARWVRLIPGFSKLPRVLGRDERKLGWRARLARFGEVASGGPLSCYLNFLSPTSPELSRVLRRSEFVESLDGFSAMDVFAKYYANGNARDLLGKLMYVDIKTVLADAYLVKEDRMTMAHSLESRVPFLDHRIADYTASLPSRLKVQGLSTKRVLRRIARDHLPRDIAMGPKQGFEIPLAAWLRDRLAERVRDSLLEPNARVNQYLVPQVVSRVTEDHLAGRENHGKLLWTMLTLETWLRNRE